MGLFLGFGRQGCLDDFGGKTRLRFTPAARGDFPERGRAACQQTLPPATTSVAIDPKFLRDVAIAQSTGFEENNATAQDDLLRGAVGRNPCFKQFPVFIRKFEFSDSPGHAES
jgi:hypothetical protein